MILIITPDGLGRTLYSEEIDLATLGTPTITRAGVVEPDSGGQWTVDLGPVSGPRLGPFPRRSAALEAEVSWLETHHLHPTR